MSLKDDNMESKLKIIMNFLKPNEIQKKKTGEVYTPPDLINEMLDKLEEYNPGVFSNPDLTWYDNSCGIGNFLVLVYLRLDKGLSEQITDKKQRIKHIVEKMIYGVDINSLNVSVCKFLLGIDYQSNIICGDGLSQETHKGMTFDVIVGNPPYQKSSINDKAVGGKGLWCQFVNINLNILKENGFMIFIHPAGWRRMEDATGKKIKQHQIHFLKTRLKPFKNAEVFVDWYILQKNFKGNYKDLRCIPNDVSKISLSIHKKILCSEKKFNVKITSKYGTNSKLTSRIKNNDYKYKIFHTNNQVIFSKAKPEYYDSQKIIVSDVGKFLPFYDNGQYGTSQDAMYFLVENEYTAKEILEKINSGLNAWFLKNNQCGNFRNDWRVINELTLDKLDLTEEEQEYINNYKV